MLASPLAAVTGLLWLVALIHLVGMLRAPRKRAPRYLFLTFAAIASAGTLTLPGVQADVADALATPNVNDPMLRSSLLIAAWSGQGLLLAILNPAEEQRHRRLRTAVLTVCVCALWALFVSAGATQQTRTFMEEYGSRPRITAYLLASLAYLTYAFWDIRRGCKQISSAASGALGTGVRLIGLSSVFSIAYTTLKAGFLLLLLTGSDSLVNLPTTLPLACAIIAGILAAIGCSTPITVRTTTWISSRVTTWVANRQLYPLWQALYQAVPTIALDPPRSKLHDIMRVDKLDSRLYRRVIEIRDARLELQLQPSTRIQVSVADLTADNADLNAEAAREARTLFDALAARRRRAAQPSTLVPSAVSGTDIASEAQWLMTVSREYKKLIRNRPDATQTGVLR